MKSRLYKLLSILLSITMLVTVCAVATNAQDAAGNVYYVKYGGTGDGKTVNTPAGTVAKAVETVNADGLGAGDIATIYIMQDEALTKAGKATIDPETNYHNITAWRDAAAGEEMPAHTATISLQPYDTSIVTYLAESTRYGDIHPIIGFKGPAIVGSLGFVFVRNNDNDNIYFNGNNIQYDHRSMYSSHFQLGGNGSFGQGFAPVLSIGGAASFDKPVTFNMTGSQLFNNIHVGDQRSTPTVYNEDVNLIFNNPEIGAHASLPVAIVLNGGLTFKKNLNVYVLDVSDISFSADQKFTAGAINYFVMPGEVVDPHLTDMDRATGPKFRFNLANKEAAEILIPTETPGTFNVADGKAAVVTDADGNQIISENGVLTIPEGEYTLDEFIPPVTKEFFVISGGTGDGTSRENPASSVEAVIPAINAAGLSTRDIALVTILERADWNAAPVSDVHNMSYLGGFSSNVVPKVVIQGDPESETKVHLAYNNHTNDEGYRNIGIHNHLTFRNLVWVNTCRDSHIYLYGNNITFEDTVDAASAYQWGGGELNGSEITRIDPTDYISSSTFGAQKIEIGANFTQGVVYIPGGAFTPVTYSDNFEIELDNPNIGRSGGFSIGFASNHANASTIKFTKALNINVRNASKVNFISTANDNGKQKVLVTQGIQVILNANTEYNTTNLYDVSSIDPNSPLYTIINNSGDGDALSFTKTVGTYKVSKGYVAVATNTETKKKYTSDSGLLTVPEAGTYTVELEKEPDAKDYYVISGGTGDGRTAETPAGSVAQVVASINADGLVKGDFANINVMQRSDWNAIPEGSIGNIDGTLTTQRHNMTSWIEDGESVPAHAATIVLKKATTATTYLAFTPYLGDNSNLDIAGPTIFEGVTLVCMRKLERQIITGNNDVTFGTNVSYGYIDLDCFGAAAQWDGVVKSATGFDTAIAPTNYSAANNFNKEFTTTIKGTAGTLILGSVGYGGTVYNEDYNIVVDSQTANQAIKWGGTDARNGNTFKKNLNIHVKAAPAIIHTSGSTNVNVEGAIQAIYSEATAVSTAVSSLTNVTATAGIWELVNKSDNADALAFTDVPGTFDVVPGFVAVAKNTVTEEVTASIDGVLTIPAGSYEITVCDYFANTGDELYIYNASEIDLADVDHDEKDGMLFVGWIDTKTNEPAKQVDNYVFGDVLKAKYVPYTEDSFKMEETEARDASSLRYIFTQDKALLKEFGSVVEYGALTLPTTNGFEFFLDRGAVESWSWNADTKADFIPASYSTPAVKVVAKNVLEESNEYLKYTLCLTNIEKSKTRTFYGARGYLIYNDLNGIQHTLYSTQRQSSLYKAAAETPEAEQNDVTKAVVKYAEEDLTAAYWASNPITSYHSGVEGTELSDPKYLMYQQAGIRIAHPTINTGMDVEEFDFVFFTDPHFNYTDEVDIYSGNPTLLANYRARTWVQHGASAGSTNNIMDYAANFKKVVVGGDAIDFFANGCTQMVYRLLTEKSVNGSVKMVLGNHETMEIGGNPLDIPYSNKWTREEKMDMVQKYWTNNVYYDSEIIAKTNGDDNLMFIYMDNHSGEFTESQIEPLKADLAMARAKNIPVFIFFHTPIPSYNPADKEIYVDNSYGGGSYGTPSKNTGKRNYCDGDGYLGTASSSAASQEVIKTIRSHADVVKGVLDGHEHEWAVSSIVGIDDNGNANGLYIPQYNIYGSHYGGACRVTVK